MLLMFFFFKQKPAYEMRISDWSSDVCSSDLPHACDGAGRTLRRHGAASAAARSRNAAAQMDAPPFARFCYLLRHFPPARRLARAHRAAVEIARADRSEEHTYELQSLMRKSYAVFCLKKKQKKRSHLTS